MALYKRASSVITLHEPNRSMRINENSDIVVKSNISIWGNPRKIGISCSYKGSIVQALSRINK